ncbi:type VI secretion system protein TssR domain-containing protein [Deminuibacter soli]|uniref:VWA domain-containing protein n=1 Tax=Deminuibacter soli TaxID=2291815 RepID=A0A3E1NCV6_9BACT|nr:type VI secretion system protein TssR domain-containing protein [Deminuibacter soli]RFM25598.1 VWA domain-containing protein [Deminuibacter soli]
MKQLMSVLFVLATFSSMAQLPKKRVLGTPTNYINPSFATIALEPSGNDKTMPWIVFSDREDNVTYTSPGGSLAFKKIAFMQPFVVGEEDKGYLKLYKYDPAMLTGRKMRDRKRAVSFGWIGKDKLLMWQKSLEDEQTHFPMKALAVASGKAPLTQPKYFYSYDSVILYNSPELKDQLNEKLHLHDFVYVFKISGDGRKALVGHVSQLTTDSARNAIAGWVSTEVIHAWGSRLYIGLPRDNDYARDSLAAAVVNAQLESTKSSVHPAFQIDPLLAPGNPVFRSLPVMDRKQNEKGGTTFRSSVAEDVFNKSLNSVINIKGARLDFKTYLQLRRFSNQVNVVFVVDGGSGMKNYMPGLTNTIQNFESVFLQKKFAGYRYQYGAVVYKSSDGCGSVKPIAAFPLSQTYSKVVDFLNQQAAFTQQCSGNIYNQPVLQGLQEAANMLKTHPMETNLIVLTGSTGNNGLPYSVTESTVIDAMVKADARLLTLQVYNKFDPAFNNFVIETRQLLERTAQQQAALKKMRMVKGEGLAATQTFNTSFTDSVTYYLNYPDGSLIPGGIVFPGRGAVKTNKEMISALNRFVTEVDTDNKDIIQSLDSAFRETGRLRERVTPDVEGSITQSSPPVPDHLGEALPHNAFKYYFELYFRNNPAAAKQSPLQYAIILSQDEMIQVSDVLSRMSGDNLQQDASGFRKQLYRSYVTTGVNWWNNRYSKREIRSMKIGDYFEQITGMPLQDSLMNSYTVSDIKSDGDLSRENFELIILHLRKCNQVLKRQLQLNEYFTSNGRPYYYVLQQDWRADDPRKQKKKDQGSMAGSSNTVNSE